MWVSLFCATIGFCIVGSVQAANSSTHLILRMGDGRFYDPSTGRSAATESELLAPGLPIASPPVIVPLATTTTVSPSQAASSTAQTTTTNALPESPLIRAVQRGKQLLVEQALSSSTKATTDEDWRYVNLAVWTPETDEIVMVRTQKKGSGLRLLDHTDTFRIQVRTPNGLDSTYTVTSLLAASTTPRVVAVRYPLYHPTKTGKKTTYRLEEVIYTPYARSLHTPEAIARGRAFLDQQIAEVYTDLETKKIPSATYPNKLVTEVVRPEVAKAILLIEHTGQDALKTDPQNTVDVFYAELGLNEKLTYAYEESPVGALGAPQFMPGTYKLLARQPELELDPDFTRGMRNLENSMTAQVVYLDRLLSVMPDDVQTAYLSKPYEAGAYVVASYNAGEVRVRRAVQAWGEDWDATHSGQAAKLQTEQNRLAKDIAGYKQKLKTKAVKASASKTKEIKKQLGAAQSRYTVLDTQIDALKRNSLRPETFYYLQKYRLALPYLTNSASMVQEASTSTTTIAHVSSL